MPSARARAGRGVQVSLTRLVLFFFLISLLLVEGPRHRRPRPPGEPVPFIRAIWFAILVAWPLFIFVPLFVLHHS